MNSGWTVEITRKATKQLGKLDPQITRRILDYLRRLEADLEPIRVAKPLKGSQSNLSRFRVGDYRMICKLDEASSTILVLSVVHRKNAYRK